MIDNYTGPWITRDMNGTLKIWQYTPYLVIGEHEKIVVGREEFAHDCFEDVYGAGPNVIEPYWRGKQCNSWGEPVEYERHLCEINSELFSHVTFESGPYHLKDLRFWNEEEKEKHTIIN